LIVLAGFVTFFSVSAETSRKRVGSPVSEMGISNPWGIPNSWLFFHGKSQTKMDDFGVPQKFQVTSIYRLPLLPTGQFLACFF
jgi:hypothetical protein